MAEPRLDRTVLFHAGERGYSIFRIPGIVATPRGTLLAYCEARRGVGDWGSIDILMRRSVDGGATWETARMLGLLGDPVSQNPVGRRPTPAGPDEVTYNNPLAIVDRDGVIHFLCCVEYARCFYLRSTDDGLTFSQPVEITATFERFKGDYAWKVLATGPGHGLCLQNGRLVVPVWLSLGTGSDAHHPSCVGVIYSDDGGATWQAGEIVANDSLRTPHPSETVGVELRDGRVMLNIRNQSPRHRRLVSLSADGATAWSEPAFDEALFEPVCFASLCRLSAEPSRLLFVNPNSARLTPPPEGRVGWPRQNLTVRLSYDEGQTWPVSRVLEEGLAGYADLAVGPDGTIYCAYEGGRVAGATATNAYAYLAVARFSLEWLTRGADSAEK